MQFNDDSVYIITINHPQYYDKLVGLKSSPNARLIVRFTTLYWSCHPAILRNPYVGHSKPLSIIMTIPDRHIWGCQESYYRW